MAAAKYGTPVAGSALTLSSVNSLANGSASGLMTFDNSSGKHVYATVAIVLGSITTAAGASISLVQYTTQGATAPSDLGAVGGGNVTVIPLPTGTGTKTLIPVVQLMAPESLRFQLINNAGVALASSGNSITVSTFSEDVT